MKRTTEFNLFNNTLFSILLILFVGLSFVSNKNVYAEVPLDSLKVKLSLQYRTMYNASNIPGPAGTS